MNDIRQQLTERYRHYDALARSIYPEYARMPVPRLRFYMKGRTGGMAYNSTHKKYPWSVGLNTYIASQDMAVADNTISHEIAHMVDFAIRYKSKHDATWRAIHRRLGGTGERTLSNVKVIPARNSNWYLYRNASGAEHLIGPRHHSALRKTAGAYVKTNRGNVFFAKDWTGEVQKRA